MKDLITVASFTMKEMVKRRSFLISTIIIIGIIILGFNVPNVLNSIKGENGNALQKILIIDEEDIFEGSLENLNLMNLGYNFEIERNKIELQDVKNKIIDGQIVEALYITPDSGKIKLQYIVKNLALIEQMPQEFINAVSNVYSGLQISKLNLNSEQMASLTPEFEFELQQAEEKEVKVNVFVTMILSLVLFYAIYFCAYQVSSSITTEKTSKIMETLVTSTKPRTIVLGKTLGIGIVGLIQITVLAATALISAKTFLPEGTLEKYFDLSVMTPSLAIITLVYFILGYSAFALMYALTGSTVSKPEDINSANSPVAMLSVIGFYLAYFTMMNPTGDLNTFAALFPFSSPFCMPLRVMMGIVDLKEILISVGILLATIVIIAKVSIKIYSSAILNYGTKMSLKDVIKVYKDKNN